MAAKQLLYSEDARKKLMKGVRQMADAVKITLGPTGRTVIFERSFGAPRATKDGVAVAKEVELKDGFENMGAKLMKEVASKTSDVAGDGTTTATVLAEAVLAEGLKLVTAGANPTALRRGLDRAAAAAIEAIERMSRDVKGKEDIIAEIVVCIDTQVFDYLDNLLSRNLSDHYRISSFSGLVGVKVRYVVEGLRSVTFVEFATARASSFPLFLAFQQRPRD